MGDAMNKDDIIRMAREAGWDMDDNLTDIFGFGVRLERFANLVAAAKAEVALAEAYRCGYEVGAAAEREAIPKLAMLAKAIRMRSQT